MKCKNVLWAMTSICTFKCKFCYLDFSEKNEVKFTDILLPRQLEIIESIAPIANNLWIAGGEPLRNTNLSIIINSLVNNGINPILCTNGNDLVNSSAQEMLLKNEIKAISISLDSSSPRYHNHYRPRNEWSRIIDGIKKSRITIDRLRLKTKIGAYMTVSNQNLNDISKLYELCNDIGIDYFVFQPMTLNETHPLYKELILASTDAKQIEEEYTRMKALHGKTVIPPQKYTDLFTAGLRNETLNETCEKDNLRFIDAKGEMWICPNVQDFSANKDCNFNINCTNMWLLSRFDSFLENDMVN